MNHTRAHIQEGFWTSLLEDSNFIVNFDQSSAKLLQLKITRCNNHLLFVDLEQLKFCLNMNTLTLQSSYEKELARLFCVFPFSLHFDFLTPVKLEIFIYDKRLPILKTPFSCIVELCWFSTLSCSPSSGDKPLNTTSQI